MHANLEVGRNVMANGIRTNVLDRGQGFPVLLIHGSGPGVTGYANWCLTIPPLAREHRVIVPDIVGFGETERPAGYRYNLDNWVRHALGVLDALEIEKAHIVGNSFGGALALAMASRAPERVGKLVLMGSVGIPFTITAGLDKVWGYTPSLEEMKALFTLFAFDRSLVSDELVRLRYHSSIRPGYQETYASMFPAPRQRWVNAMVCPDEAIRALPHETLILHGREDQVIPLQASFALLQRIGRAQLHVFGQCGHWIQIEHAETFSQLLLGHFSR
jgi:2-hydroxymuconate-semialdehyde hydrolase